MKGRRIFDRMRAGFLLALALTASVVQAESFTFTILHTNDLHARVDPVTVRGKSIGGYARQATAILQARESSTNPILLNAGDVFQGTLYFNVYEGLADLSFLNLIGYQVMAVGNHEFDRGPEPLANFARLARFPLLAANLDLSKEPKLQDMIKPSMVLEVGGEKIGIVGTTPPNLLTVTAAGDTIAMKEYLPSVQAAVDGLRDQGINKIILLSHAGFEHDTSTVGQLRGVDIIVGGHSHTLLGQVDIPGFEGSRGEYPTLGKDATGETVLIVQAWEWGKVLGKLEVTFDETGKLEKWNGGPILIDDKFEPNPYVLTMMEAFAKPIAELRNRKISELANDLTQRFDEKLGEPLMGNVIADAVLDATKHVGAEFAFWNAGGVRSPLSAGQITYGNLIEVCPFGNTLTVNELTGEEILKSLEHGVSSGGGMLLPSKGFSYTFNPSAPAGSRLISASFNGEAIDPKRVYKVTLSNFVANGGDAHEVLKNAKGARVDTGFIDVDALIAYFQKNNPVKMTTEGRIVAKTQ